MAAALEKLELLVIDFVATNGGVRQVAHDESDDFVAMFGVLVMRWALHFSGKHSRCAYAVTSSVDKDPLPMSVELAVSQHFYRSLPRRCRSFVISLRADVTRARPAHICRPE
jgi:hypothetical protein